LTASGFTLTREEHWLRELSVSESGLVIRSPLSERVIRGVHIMISVAFMTAGIWGLFTNAGPMMPVYMFTLAVCGGTYGSLRGRVSVRAAANGREVMIQNRVRKHRVPASTITAIELRRDRWQWSFHTRFSWINARSHFMVVWVVLRDGGRIRCDAMATENFESASRRYGAGLIRRTPVKAQALARFLEVPLKSEV
jgi:hypothetical protein